MPPSAAPDPLALLLSAIHNDNAREVDQLLTRHPSLRLRLNAPHPAAPFGQTPLLAAVDRRNRDVIDALLRHGADVNARSGWWAGGFGVLDADHDLHDFLIARGATLNAYSAARLGRLDTLAKILDAAPAQVHLRGGDGQTPLHVAKDVETATLLLARGADIDALDVDHESTPAQYAIRERQAVAAYLVNRGCRTDLLLVTALGRLDLVRQHLDADPAALRTSVSEQYFPMTNPRAGGHVYTWTLGKDKTAHAVARDFRREDVLHLLMDRSPAGLKLAAACELGDESLVDSLLAAGASPAPEDHPRNATAAVHNNTPPVRHMLRAGWPTDPRAQHGGTPLHWAAFHGNADMTRALLSHGAPLELQDTDHHSTALGWALFGSRHGWHCKTGDYVATVHSLLTAGATPRLAIEVANASDAVRQLFYR